MNIPKLSSYLNRLSISGDLDQAELVRTVIETAPYVPNAINDNVVLSGTTAATTTSFLAYGVNNITTASPTAYAIRLPYPPQKGKQVIIVNNSTMPVAVYPSVDGGSINGTLNGVGMVPNDGKAYTFYCYENPLPGAWSWTPPALNQYDSGVITVNSTGGTKVIAASSAANWLEGDGFYSSTGFGNDGLNSPLYTPAYIQNQGGINYPAAPFKPAQPWNRVTKLKVYTNLSATLSGVVFGLTQGTMNNYYYQGTTNLQGATPGSSGNLGAYGNCSQTVPGATLAQNALTTNIGDPGTCYGELAYTSTNPPLGSESIGNFYKGLSTQMGQTVDWYQTRSINFGIQPKAALTGLKFRFFIEYN